MKTTLSTLRYSVLAAAVVFAAGLAPVYAERDPYYGDRDDYPSDRGYLRGAPDDYDRHDRREHELALERDRLDQERRALEAQQYAQSRQQENCPSGFQRSEDKCSPEERRKGCKDVRLSNGMGCVKR